MRKITKSLAALALSAGLLGACGGTSANQKAVDEVCSARTDLHNSIDTVKTDVTSLNFGKAKDELANVKKAFDNLVDSAKKLKTEQAKALDPKIDSLKTSVQNLTNVSSLSELQSGLSTVSAQIQSLYTEITNTLKCP
jgi:predicted  nucleic acid-binding Zn-ribbon protein